METSRLILRPFVSEDFDDYFSYIMEPELQKMLGLNGVTDRESAQQTFDWLCTNRTFLALVSKDSGHVIGHIALHPPYEAAAALRENKCGYSLSFAVSEKYRRKGLMEEALRLLISELFQNNVDFLDCEYTADNLPSCNLQKKLGFCKVAVEQFDGMELTVCILDRTFP